MSKLLLPLLALLALLLQSSTVKADDAAPDPNDLTKWQITGADVTVDPSNKHSNSPGSFKISPQATATLPLRADAGSGSVTLWILMTARPRPIRANTISAPLGLIGPDGHVLFAGILYALISREKKVTSPTMSISARKSRTGFRTSSALHRPGRWLA